MIKLTLKKQLKPQEKAEKILRSAEWATLQMQYTGGNFQEIWRTAALVMWVQSNKRQPFILLINMRIINPCSGSRVKIKIIRITRFKFWSMIWMIRSIISIRVKYVTMLTSQMSHSLINRNKTFFRIKWIKSRKCFRFTQNQEKICIAHLFFQQIL